MMSKHFLPRVGIAENIVPVCHPVKGRCTDKRGMRIQGQATAVEQANGKGLIAHPAPGIKQLIPPRPNHQGGMPADPPDNGIGLLLQNFQVSRDGPRNCYRPGETPAIP